MRIPAAVEARDRRKKCAALSGWVWRRTMVVMQPNKEKLRDNTKAWNKLHEFWNKKVVFWFWFWFWYGNMKSTDNVVATETHNTIMSRRCTICFPSTIILIIILLLCPFLSPNINIVELLISFNCFNSSPCTYILQIYACWNCQQLINVFIIIYLFIFSLTAVLSGWPIQQIHIGIHLYFRGVFCRPQFRSNWTKKCVTGTGRAYLFIVRPNFHGIRFMPSNPDLSVSFLEMFHLLPLSQSSRFMFFWDIPTNISEENSQVNVNLHGQWPPPTTQTKVGNYS